MKHRVRLLVKAFLLLSSLSNSVPDATAAANAIDFGAIPSPIIFHGNGSTAYRDPAAIYSDGWFHLYFEINTIGPDRKAYIRTAWSKSRDLLHWTEPRIFTPRDRNLNFGSPGDVIRFQNQWVLCLQNYPRPNGELFGNNDSRLWLMRSEDLEHWGAPELIEIKGPDVSRRQMGRMIDPFLLQDKDDSGKWWCFFKQAGSVYLSSSRDLKTWHFTGLKVTFGENPCVIRNGGEYVLYYAPPNGIGVQYSPDLIHWTRGDVLTLGQKEWPWAQGRLTAGFVLDLRADPKVAKALMFFHGSQFPEGDPRGGFDNFASLGFAWSSDLKTWNWPQSRSRDGALEAHISPEPSGRPWKIYHAPAN